MTEAKKQSEKNAPETGKNKKGLVIISAVAAVILVAFTIWGLWLATHPKPEPIEGQMDATTIDIASKIPGRIEKVSVKEGDRVALGDVVAEISIPEIEAKVNQAKAVTAARNAQASLAEEGARPQEIQAARAMYERANAAAVLAQKSYDRVARLYKEGFVPAQRLDEATANLTAANNAAKAAKEQWNIAQTGARKQEKEAAKALASQAAGGLAEAESYAGESIVRSPLNGEVIRVLLHPGEVAPQGFPILTVIDLADQWASFNIREDLLPGLKVGSVIKVKVPAIGGGARDFKVYYISAKADYATWRSTRENSGYDLKTFEVRARPVETIDGLRPGMTALIER